jgi:hypothetical protein
MSQRYATIAADVLKTDSILYEWASGGILDRDPRRSGPNATGEVFDTDEMGDIRPTIACTGANATRSLGGPQSAYEDTVVIRIFTPDYTRFYGEIDAITERITAMLFGYRHSNDRPSLFRWNSRLGIQAGGAFEDVAYEEIRFRIVGLHAGVPT